MLLLSGFITAVVTIISLRSKLQKGATPFAVLMSALTLWSFCYAAELLSSSLTQTLFIAKLEYIGIVVIPPAWLYFALCLNPWEKLKNRRVMYMLLVLPVIILIFVWTNDYHHLFWKQNDLIYINNLVVMKNSYGPIFWVHFCYSYLLIILGTVLLFYRYLVTNTILRYRIVYLFIPIFPLVANILQFTDLNPSKHLDLTPLAFTISGLMILVGSLKKFQLEIIPIARNLVFDNIEDGFIITNHVGEVLDCNLSAYKITGYREIAEIQSYLINNFKDNLKGEEQIQVELNDVFLRPNILLRITPFFRKNRLVGKLITLSDITQQKQASVVLEDRVQVRTLELAESNQALMSEIQGHVKAQERIKYLAYHDHLTSLPNRLLLSDRVNQSIHLARRLERTVGLMFLDLDSFKMVNDTMGHNRGDELLIEVAKRLFDTLRKCDTVARIGGDEFVIMVQNLNNAEDIIKIAEKVLHSFNKPFKVSSQDIYITASIGISVYPTDGEDCETLLKNSDIAMYKAKDKGRNRYMLCSSVMKDNILRSMKLSNSLYHALARNELEIYYQPQLNSKSKKIIGIEALLRWNHPELGMIAPQEFIPLAEQTGLIVPIGKWVLLNACIQNKIWQDIGLPQIPVAVNLSMIQIQNPNTANQIADILELTGLDPSFLELEITESVAMKEIDYIIEILNSFKKIGVTLTIDDFGTEYSSLKYLKQLPIDRIKIAMQFVQGIGTSEKDKAITKAIIVLARNLGMSIIAEGVETEQQLSFLTSQRCDEVQGYYFCKPLPSNETEPILRNNAIIYGNE